MRIILSFLSILEINTHVYSFISISQIMNSLEQDDIVVNSLPVASIILKSRKTIRERSVKYRYSIVFFRSRTGHGATEEREHRLLEGESSATSVATQLATNGSSNRQLLSDGTAIEHAPCLGLILLVDFSSRSRSRSEQRRR